MSLFSPTPPNSYFANPPPPLNDVTFGKWPFEKMSGGLGENSEPLPRFWDLEEYASIGTFFYIWPLRKIRANSSMDMKHVSITETSTGISKLQ